MTLDKNAMFEIIKKVEGEYSAPYYDSVGLVTIGVGFNIENGLPALRNSVLITLGIGEITINNRGKEILQRKTLYKADGAVDSAATTKLVTYFESLKNLIENDTYNGSSSKAALDAESARLNTNLNAIMSQIQSDPLLSDYKSSFHSTFSLTHSEVKNIFDSIIDTYSTNVDVFLNSISGGDKLAISSEMYQALVSLSYNGLSMTQSSMPGLADAIKNGNRAEAWFQIRYDTNKKSEAGVYKRRFFESEIFGVFAGSTPTEEEAKDFFKMMRYHEPKIKTINETDVVANANRDYGSGSAHALDTFQKDALSKLTELYGQGVEIQNAIVGTDTVNDNSSNRGKENIDDILKGTEKNDLIFGEKGKDQLIGGAGSDVLYGGEDFDTYIAGNGDTINDSDGEGLINFNGIDLSGVKTKVKDTDSLYEDKEGFTYEEKDGKLIITKDSESITIDNWSEVVKTTDKTKVALGIKLSEGGDVEVSTESNSAIECLEEMPIPVKLDRVVASGEEIVVQVGYYYNITEEVPYGAAYWVARWRDDYTGNWYGGYMYQPTKTIVIGQAFCSYGEVTFSEGEQEKDFIYRWDDNAIEQPNRTYPMIPKLDETNSTYGDSIKVTIDQSGTGTIIDDDPRTRIDPVILDTNKDGFISTTPLATSTTYFDITGDGIKTSFYFFTCKHFHTNKSLHVKNEIQHKGANSGEKARVA